MLTEILPKVVAVEERRSDPDDPFLFPEEAALLARAVPKRRTEFATARLCARTALATLGHPPAPILPGPKGAPQWPSGVVGAITHCAGYRAAAVARATELAAVGIDAEPHGPLPEGVLRVIGLPVEVDQLVRLGVETPGTHWDRLLFSAKESVYKAWFPLTGQWLGFEDAEITFSPAGTFTVGLRPTGALPAGTVFAGRWLVRAGLALTAVTVPPFPA